MTNSVGIAYLVVMFATIIWGEWKCRNCDNKDASLAFTAIALVWPVFLAWYLCRLAIIGIKRMFEHGRQEREEICDD